MLTTKKRCGQAFYSEILSVRGNLLSEIERI